MRVLFKSGYYSRAGTNHARTVDCKQIKQTYGHYFKIVYS